jgi:hypothetical protein
VIGTLRLKLEDITHGVENEWFAVLHAGKEKGKVQLSTVWHPPLRIIVNECKDLEDKERFGSQDPYVKLQLGGTAYGSGPYEFGNKKAGKRQFRYTTHTADSQGVTPHFDDAKASFHHSLLNIHDNCELNDGT